MTKTYCDMCQKELPHNSLEHIAWYPLDKDGRTLQKHVDVCPKCLKALESFIETYDDAS